MKKTLFITAIALLTLSIVSCHKEEDDNGRNGGNGNTGNIVSGVYVDLGLPSGVKWKDENENGGLYGYDAIRKYGDQVPTKEMYEELMEQCEWNWIEEEGFVGYKVTGPNGNHIKLPANGCEILGEGVVWVGTSGIYWTSSPLGSHLSWCLCFYSSFMVVQDCDHGSASAARSARGLRYIGRSLRLVQIGDQTVYDVPAEKRYVELVYGNSPSTTWQHIELDTIRKYNADNTIDSIFMIADHYNQFSTLPTSSLQVLINYLRERKNINPNKVWGKGEMQLGNQATINNPEIVRFFADTLGYTVTYNYGN